MSTFTVLADTLTADLARLNQIRKVSQARTDVDLSKWSEVVDVQRRWSVWSSAIKMTDVSSTDILVFIRGVGLIISGMLDEVIPTIGSLVAQFTTVFQEVPQVNRRHLNLKALIQRGLSSDDQATFRAATGLNNAYDDIMTTVPHAREKLYDREEMNAAQFIRELLPIKKILYELSPQRVLDRTSIGIRVNDIHQFVTVLDPANANPLPYSPLTTGLAPPAAKALIHVDSDQGLLLISPAANAVALETMVNGTGGIVEFDLSFRASVATDTTPTNYRGDWAVPIFVDVGTTVGGVFVPDVPQTGFNSPMQHAHITMRPGRHMRFTFTPATAVAYQMKIIGATFGEGAPVLLRNGNLAAPGTTLLDVLGNCQDSAISLFSEDTHRALAILADSEIMNDDPLLNMLGALFLANPHGSPANAITAAGTRSFCDMGWWLYNQTGITIPALKMLYRSFFDYVLMRMRLLAADSLLIDRVADEIGVDRW